MVSKNGKKKLVVLQLTGGNDYLNCVVPYTNEHYYDGRPAIRVPQEDVIPLDDHVGFHPAMEPMKELFDQGDMAIIHGVGYPNPSRSHFRSMDIWHTCEPDKVATEGWLGRALRDIDPEGENVVGGVNFGGVLPRALACPGVPIASVNDLDNYGLLTSMAENEQRKEALEVFSRMYTPTIGKGWVGDYLGKTGINALKGADILRSSLDSYSSTVEYADNPIAKNLRSIAQVMFADVGTRVFYTSHGSFDTHTGELATHNGLWTEISRAVMDFYADLKEHNAQEDVILLMFSEFGRRLKDNGSGTDHGQAGVAFVIGDSVNGGMYSEYPSLHPSDLIEGDPIFSLDFRGVYSDILENWLHVDPVPIVEGQFEKPNVLI